MKILFTVAPAALVLLLFTVSAVAANSNAEFMARVNDWSRIADVHHECTDKVKSLEARDTLETFLQNHDCLLTYLQCKRAFTNKFVDMAEFNLQAVSEQDDTYILEVYCFRASGEYTFPSQNVSFIAFVADSQAGQVTEDQKGTFRFYKDLEAVEMVDPYFGEFYRLHTGAAQILVWLPLVTLPVMIQKMLF